MKKKITAVLVTALCAVALFAVAGCGSNTALRFVTGGESGTYYAFGGVIASHATSNAGLKVTVTSSGGSQANIEEITDGKAEIGFCQSDVMAYAYEGIKFDAFTKSGANSSFSTIGSLYLEQVQIVTTNPDIKSVSDLKGKKVSIGASGSGVYFNALDILGAYGLSEDDIVAQYQSFADSTDSLKNGQIDAAFVVAGAPTTAVTDLASTKATYLVSLDEDIVTTLVALSPYYTAVTIPAGTYTGVDTDVKTVAVGAVLIASNKVSEDAIYKLTKDIFEDPQSLVANHAKYAEVNIENGASVTSVPYHPGAAKYFKEKGITVPTASTN